MRPVIDVDDPAFGDAQPSGLLDEYRVDLFDLLREGVPKAEYVPGCEGFVRAGKRYLIPAPAGTGKSLAWLRISIGIVQAGGSVVILDVENGAGEYLNRLECILSSCGDLSSAEEARLRYYEWPRLSLKWNADEWLESIGDANIVIFDSSRFTLSQVGLDENSANDYAEFVDALLLPLSKAGIATVVLDNTGHSDSRARGSKAKEDLNEVVFEVSARGSIDLYSTGTLKFNLTRSRFAGLHRQLEMKIGGGVYEMPEAVEQSYDDDGNWRPTVLMERVADYLAEHPGAGIREIKDNVKGDNTVLPTALKQLVREGYVTANEHRLVKPFVG